MSFGNVMIFGDSYSTYKGYIPEGYAVYYSGNRTTPPDLSDVTKTWWHQVIEESGSNLVQNNSWSGSTICYTGYGYTDRSKSSSFIYRLERMIEEGFFKKNKIDTVFVFGGTNDSWSQAPIGQAQYSDWSHDSLFFVLPAVCYFLNRLKETLPEATIVCMINNGINGHIQQEMAKICEYYGVKCVSYVGKPIEKVNGHPTEQGMIDIKNHLLESLKQ